MTEPIPGTTDDRPRGDDRLTSDDRPAGPRAGTVVGSHVWTWDEEDVRRGLPWLGVFLVVFGGILLLGQAYPGLRVLGSGLTTAIGVALLVSWATHRSWGLYPGLLITGYSLPGLLEDIGVLARGAGYGTFLFGAGLLTIAAMRWRQRDTWGWQLYVGGLLAVAGGAEIASRIWPGSPNAGAVLWAVVLIGMGLAIVARAFRR